MTKRHTFGYNEFYSSGCGRHFCKWISWYVVINPTTSEWRGFHIFESVYARFDWKYFVTSYVVIMIYYFILEWYHCVSSVFNFVATTGCSVTLSVFIFWIGYLLYFSFLSFSFVPIEAYFLKSSFFACKGRLHFISFFGLIVPFIQ